MAARQRRGGPAFVDGKSLFRHPPIRNRGADCTNSRVLLPAGQPILSSVFRYDIPLFGAVAQRAWDNEILTIATNGSGEVRRHCHHRSIYDPNDFYSQAEANIDPSGQYALFTSNWGQNVGAGRTDVFMVKLSL